MNNYIIISNPSGLDCVNLNQGYVKVCLIKQDCNPSDPDGNLVDPDNQWNCNLCQTDREYFLPILPDDIFMFQTRFFDGHNTDPENPEDGLGTWVHLEVNDAAGDTVYTEATPDLVLRSIVAHTGRTPYQMFEIDFNVINLECFSLRFFTEDGQAVATQHFTKILKRCQNSLVIRSTQLGRDNAGNYYGSPAGVYVGDLFTFDNAIRVNATIETSGQTLQKTSIGRGRVTTVVTEDISLLVFPNLVPHWLLGYLTKSILSGQVIAVDGRNYTISGYEKKRDDPHQRMYFVEIPLVLRVENSGYEC